MRLTLPRARIVRLLGPAVLGAAIIGAAAPPAPVAASISPAAYRVIRIAKAQIGDAYRYGAMGPYRFDCSGLVLYSFKQAGYYSRVGSGRYRSALSLYRWFRYRHLSSRTGGRPGDLVVWGGGSHIGIYLGNGWAISALLSGVRVHRVAALTSSFTAYLHTRL